MEDIRRSYCGLCHPRCGTLLYIKENRIVKVTGDPNHPITRGVICQRGKLMSDHVYHPDRLNYPLKRIGEKGQGHWQQLSWEQALDEVADKLSQLRDKYGAETLAFTHGTKRTYHWDCRRFFNLFGSPNTCGAAEICMCPSYATEFATYGGYSYGDIMNSKCVVVWGANLSKAQPTTRFAHLVMAKKNGAKIIVIDPRRTKEAKMADLWLQIHPGTDVALMLCWIRKIIEEDLFDHDFVENWTVGFEELKTAVSSYTVNKVAEITKLPPELIEKSVRMYANTHPGVILWGLGQDKHGINATQTARARAIIRAITGNLEVLGGELFSQAGEVAKARSAVDLECNDEIPASQRVKQLSMDKYPFFGFPGWEKNTAANGKLPPGYVSAPEAYHANHVHPWDVFNAAITGEPYPITAAITLASNPLLTLANTMRTFEALKSLQLYVVMDYYLTPSAAMADYVFPASSTVEQPELWATNDFLMACPAGIAPLHERRNSYYFYRELGIRLGQVEHWPWENVEEVYDYCLQPIGLTFKDLIDRYGILGKREYRRYEQFGFGTPSGKVELYSSIFEELGSEPLPLYREPVWNAGKDPDFSKKYPLNLITGSRFMPMYNSEQRQIEKARQQNPDPLVTLNPQTARELGLNQGDWAIISTFQGKIRQRVNISEDMPLNTADVQHGWWFPERDQKLPELFGVFESNANLLCPDDPEFCSPEIGSWPHSALMCRVEKE